MGRTSDCRLRKRYLIISLAINLGLLVIFKYINFFSGSINNFLNLFNIFYDLPYFNLLLPIGISFYTFQTLSYSIDIYRGTRKPEKHLGIFALYVSFFPQLVAGPIERSTRLLPQFYRKISFDYDSVAAGLQQMLWGMFKKVVIADRLAIVVNQVYNDPTDYTGIALIIATYFFTFQIYCDFSGYSDIAIGAAKVLGFDLINNFNRPYLANSIRDFWNRWHISLSSWFRDYLYIPLGGNRVGPSHWSANIMFIFLLSGLWHGANWTFVVWGGLHGIYMLCSNWFRNFRFNFVNRIHLSKHQKMRKALSIVFTFHIVAFAWIFFRANTLSDAIYIITHLTDGIDFFLSHILELGNGKNLLGGDLGLSKFEMLFAALLIAFLTTIQILKNRTPLNWFAAQKSILIKWPLYYALIFGTLLFGKFGAQEFIYFQF
jgi:D-alanyl-lipoteichoic acid acyltransferase DltB (MBOAT superfamily)